MFEICFSVDAEHWQGLETLLDDLGALAVTQAEGSSERFAEPGLAPDEPWPDFKVSALFDDDVDSDLIIAAVTHRVPSLRPVSKPVEDRAWNEQWKADWQPLLFNRGLCVCPSWCEAPAKAQTIIKLDPGQAFGTGTHASTGLCLDWLAAADIQAKHVIDYGTGSGVLAIAAAKLGAARVYAVDIDPTAVSVAQENVALNDCTTVIDVGLSTSLNSGDADVLVANILLEPLLALASKFHSLLKPGGRLVLAGLLSSQADDLIESYQPLFMFDSREDLDEWTLLAGQAL